MHPQNFCQILKNFAKVAKFRQLWSHCSDDTTAVVTVNTIMSQWKNFAYAETKFVIFNKACKVKVGTKINEQHSIYLGKMTKWHQ